VCVVVDEIGTCQVVEPRDDHGDDGDDHKMIKCSTWKRRKRKIKSYGDQGKCINRVLVLVIKTP
jgi:hypothetical protein